MRVLPIIFIILIINLQTNFCFTKEILLDSPIEIKHEKECGLEEFCKNYIDDIDIEKFIKQELKNDYQIVSLDKCLDIALKNNFNIAITEKEYYCSKYEYQNSLSKFLPILTTRSYISDYRGQILVGGVLRDNFHETAISVNIAADHELTQGGKQIFEAKAKKHFSRSRKHELNYTKSEILYLTTKYYYEMLLAKINIEIYLRNLIERNAQLTFAENLKNSGFGTQFDVIRSQNESSQARLSLLNALNQFRLSQSHLANIMGIEVKTALMPIENEINSMKLVDENKQIEDFFKLAKEKREDLKGYKDIIKYEKDIKKSFYTDFIPKARISFQQQFQGTINTSVRPNYIVTGLLDWTPGENMGFGTITKIKAQKEKIKARILEYENKLRNIQQSIVDSYSTSYFNKKQMIISKKRVDYTKESVKLAMLRFNNGKGILLDVIQAQSEATQAKVEYASSTIKYNISQAELLFNTGEINIETIVKNYKP